MASHLSGPSTYRAIDASISVPRGEMTEDSAGSGAEGRSRRKIARTSQAENEIPSRRQVGAVPPSRVDQKQSQAGRRRSIREHKAPLGPRPLDLSTSPKRVVSDASALAASRSFLPTSTNEPIFNPPNQGTNPRYSFGKSSDGSKDHTDSSGAYDFLPSINFDDFHASLTTSPPYEPELSDFPAPGRGIFSNIGGNVSPTKAPSTNPASAGEVKGPPPRTARRQSLLRRQSDARRPQFAAESPAMPPPNGPIPVRTRRQNNFPAPAPQNPPARSPRKSMGPAVLAAGVESKDGRDTSSSLASDTPPPSTLGRSASVGKTGRRATGSRDASSGSDIPRVNTSRNMKAKSLYHPPTSAHLTAQSMTPDHSLASTRSPGKSPGQRNHTPSSSASKRQSMVPHATGLGARTISPTDARRMKRLSMLPNPPGPPQDSPTPQPESAVDNRSFTYSPAAMFRKSVTPSSSARGTPVEANNRKSHGSGISLSSSSSLASLRPGNNTGPPNRASQNLSTSRLPTPKPRPLHTSTTGEEEEVPPVPAIPKAYESPKEATEHATFQFGKYDTSNDTSTPESATPSDNAQTKEKPTAKSAFDETRAQDKRKTKNPSSNPRHRRGLTVGSSEAEKTPMVSNAKKRNLQPLRLPPLNLLPLSTPTAARIASYPTPSAEGDDRPTTPPPKRLTAKTPSTPMTASKATFFSKEPLNDDKATFLRSSSSHFNLRTDTTAYPNPMTSAMAIPIPPSRQTATTPFASASLPKNTSGDFSYMKPRGSAEEIIDEAEAEVTAPTTTLTGPRALPQTKKDTSSVHTSTSTTSTEPETPSSGTSLRRKLSLGWKRSSSKASHIVHSTHHQQPVTSPKHARAEDQPPQPPKHSEMPPPRFPASASTAASVAAQVGSPTPKYRASLDTRRRKPSHTFTSDTEGEKSNVHGRKVSASVQAPPAYSEQPTSTTRSSSLLTPVQRILGSKSSVSTLKARNLDPNLDRDDLAADDEMKRLASKRKDFEHAAKELDELRKRAKPSERVSPTAALQVASLNIFERGEIIDFPEVYFCGTKNARKHVGDLNTQSANFGYDDDRGDYNIVLGDHLKYRYEVIDVLGKGSFGQVVRCIDHKTGILVAVKIIRNKKRFHQQALVEVNILQKLREWDPDNKHSMINFTESFYFRGHLCISTELLGMNLYEFIKAHDFKGFSLKLIRRFTKQILSSLVLLQSRRVIHCDLKPENILIAHPLHSEIKVIDFGSSCFENEKVYTYIQSRFYRSPEVILGMSYGMPIDMWSLGCILAELLTGYPIFPGENEQEQLACIMEIFGPPEKHLIEKSTRKKLFFDSLGKPRVTVSSKGRRRRPSSKTLQQALKCDDEPFLDFISRCLRWDPDRRMKPDEAMNHEFITQVRRSNHLHARPRATNATGSGGGPSPMKRVTTLQTPQRPRPLPEPPATSFKNAAAVPSQPSRDPPTSSPVKGLSGSVPNRRHSTVHALGGNAGVKRSSNGTAVGATGTSGERVVSSSLPRAAQRSVSGKPDLASAAAIASLRQR